MSLSISTAGRNSLLTTVTESIDAGTINDNGYLEIRSGTRPDDPDDEATGTLLATVQLAIPAFQDPAQGQAVANTVAEDLNIDNTGRATWFRVYDRDGNAIMDGEVSRTGRGGDIEFDTVDFVQGGLVAIQSLVLTV